MADLVRNIMETMIPDIMSLVKRKIFTRKEAKEILKAREQSEYVFLRKTSGKKDYLKAIQYEYELERTRREKFKELKLKKQKQQDYSIIRRIIFLFDRLTAKYKDNIEIWKEYCLFCYKIKSNRMFFKAVSNALSMNWGSLEIWLLAVYYHFEMNNNPFKARKTFLKALKINPNNKAFWLEYFRFELKFIQKIKERQNILGVEETKANDSDADDKSVGSYLEEEKDDDAEEKIFQIQADKSTKVQGMSEEFMSFEEKKPEKSSLKSDQNDSLALVVYESMIETFPQDNSITSEILEICGEFEGEWIEQMKESISKMAKETFSNNPIANLKTTLEMEKLNRNTFETEESSEILSKFKKFIKNMSQYMEELKKSYIENEVQYEEENAKMVLELHKTLMEHYFYLEQLRKQDSNLFLSCFALVIKSFLGDQFDYKKYLTVLEDFCNIIPKATVVPQEIKKFLCYFLEIDPLNYIILEKISYLLSQVPLEDVISKKQLAKYIEQCLKTKKIEIPIEKQTRLYINLFKITDLVQEDSEKIGSFLKESIKYLAYTASYREFLEEFLKALLQIHGIQSEIVTECFNILFKLRSGCPPEVSLFYLDALSKDNPKNPKIKQHLLKTVDWYSNNKTLWLELIKWEKNYGNPLECPNIFQRAQRFIKDTSFLDDYTALLQE